MHRIATAVAIVCLAFAAGACKKKEEKAEEPAPKTTAPETPKEPKAKTTSDHVEAIKAAWTAFNNDDMDSFREAFAEDATFEVVDGGQPTAEGRDAVLGHIGMFKTAFPDLKGERMMMFAQDNKVVTIDRMTGTHKGELMGVPPTDKKVGLPVAHIYTMNDEGKIANELVYFDAATMMGQLGVHEMPHRAAMEPTGENADAIIATGNETEKANLEKVKQVDELFATGKIDEAMSHMADDMVMTDYTMAEDITDKAKTKEMFEMWMKAIPDAKFETEWAFAAGDYVIRAGKWSGTNTGAMPEMGLKKPTNKPVSMRFVEVIKIEDGKGKHGWSLSNGMAMAQQLGLIELPEAGDDKAPKK